jgi:glycosyltransferase involved in cell wall biosynthesis
MAIVHVVDRIKAGHGRGLSALALCRTKHQAGWDVQLLVSGVHSPELLPRDLRWDALLGAPERDVYRAADAIATVAGALAAHTRPGDTLVCHEGVDLAAACLLPDRRVVAAVHSDPGACLAYLPGPALALAIRKTEHWMAWGSAVAERLGARLGIRPERVTVTGQSVDTNVRPAPHPLQGAPACLTVARIHPVKNHPLLLRACAKLADRSDVHWHFVGGCDDPAYLTRLRALARELAVTDRVTWHGYRPDARALMLGSSVSVLASHHEGMPRAVQEAMALGVPTVLPAALAGDLAHAGLPVTYSGDGQALADAVESALGIGPARLGTAACWIGRAWSWERILENWAEVVLPGELTGADL